MYVFLLNMWIMRRIDEIYLQARVAKGQITQEDCSNIINTNQVVV